MENFHYLCYVEKLSYLTGRKLRPLQNAKGSSKNKP